MNAKIKLSGVTSDATSDAMSDIAACRALLRDGSRTFLAASHLLPRAVRDPACVLYAFCRQADDAVDNVVDRVADQRDSLDASKLDAVSHMRERLHAVYAGCPQDFAADRVLAEVVTRFAIPRALPEALLEGFDWDAAGRRYETLADLQAYAARVAGTVGAMMATIMGVRRPDLVARACDLGVAMQLSNIARDVGEDARAGRLYLPLSWLREAGIDPEAWMEKPVFSDALGSVIERLLGEADLLYRRVDAGVAGLPLSCRPGIQVARTLYAEIGCQVRRQGLDSVARRAVVSAPRKVWLLTQALCALPRLTRSEPLPSLAATGFLVEAVELLPQTANAANVANRPLRPIRPLHGLNDRAGWLIDLFARLEQRDHGVPAARSVAR